MKCPKHGKACGYYKMANEIAANLAKNGLHGCVLLLDPKDYTHGAIGGAGIAPDVLADVLEAEIAYLRTPDEELS